MNRMRRVEEKIADDVNSTVGPIWVVESEEVCNVGKRVQKIAEQISETNENGKFGEIRLVANIHALLLYNWHRGFGTDCGYI